VVKDPNAPKKNVAAYMFFCKATREEIKKEDDKLSFGEIGKILGARWKEADEKDKAVRASSAPTRCKTLPVDVSNGRGSLRACAGYPCPREGKDGNSSD
jgi:hypothetical protein